MKKPKDGEDYYFIMMGEEKIQLCHRKFWQTDITCMSDLKSNNCFPTKKIAKIKLKRIKEILKVK